MKTYEICLRDSANPVQIRATTAVAMEGDLHLGGDTGSSVAVFARGCWQSCRLVQSDESTEPSK